MKPYICKIVLSKTYFSEKFIMSNKKTYGGFSSYGSEGLKIADQKEGTYEQLAIAFTDFHQNTVCICTL